MAAGSMKTGPLTEQSSPLQNGVEQHNEDLFPVFVIYQYDQKAPIKYCFPSIQPTSTIANLKNELFVEWGIPAKDQTLLLEKQELDDDTRTLGEYVQDSKILGLIMTSTVAPSIDTDLASDTPSESPQRSSVYGPTYMTNYNAHADDDEMDLLDTRPQIGLVGLKNQGATCYLNSLIQVFFLTPEFRKMIYGICRPYEIFLADKVAEDKATTQGEPEKTDSEVMAIAKPDKTKDIIFQMQMLFARMQFCKLSSVSTSGLTTSFGWDNSDIFVQHDVQELNRVLCDKLEEKMKGQDSKYTIAKLYKGAMVNMIKCTACKRVSMREEDYYDISLVIKGKQNIIQSLDEFTEVEVMKDENAYSCERCGTKQTAEKSIRFSSCPTVLNLQLKRFEFDWENNIRVKLNDEISFPPLLDMKKYMVDDQLAEQLRKERNQKETPGSEEIPDIDQDPSTLYELVGILVHSGNAGFGHYYAFIKNFVDGKWYKFNDETVSVVDESDIKEQNWTGNERISYSWIHSASIAMQRSATPYMLVYRKRSDSEVKRQTEEKESIFSMKKRRSLGDFKADPIQDTEIPPPILNFLVEEEKKREVKRKEHEKEMSSCTITVFRNRIELPTKNIKVDKSITFEQLRNEVIAAVANESSTKYYYRFRRIASRKNHTKRPMDLYKESAYEKTLSDLGLDRKQNIYLEQDTDPNFSGLGDFDDSQAFLSIRLWSTELRRPTTIRDFIVPKTTTIRQLKEMLSGQYAPLKPEEMVLVEEETEKTVHVMSQENDTLAQYSIISGDILHVEPLSPEHERDPKSNKITTSFTQQYFAEKLNKLIVQITESVKSFKRRTSTVNNQPAETKERKRETADKNKSKIASSEDPKEWNTHRIAFKIATNKTHTLKQLKDIISFNTGVQAACLRVYDKDSAGFGEGRLLKDAHGKLGALLQRFGGSKISTDLGIELLESPEELKKGDKLINTKYYNANNEYGGQLEVKINKTETMRDFKTKLRMLTGVDEDFQIISEWYNDRFYKLFPNEKETIAQARIRKNDILRMDAIRDSSLNISSVRPDNESIISFQMVQFLTWDTTSYGRKEMGTTFPILLTIPDSATLFDLRNAVANSNSVPFYNLNIGFASGFPIHEGGFTSIRELVKQSGEEIALQLPKQPEDAETEDFEGLDPDEKAYRMGEKENRDGKSFNFKSEKKIVLKRLRLRTLDVLCWEDLRTKLPEKNESQSRSKRYRDEDTLRINN